VFLVGKRTEYSRPQVSVGAHVTSSIPINDTIAQGADGKWYAANDDQRTG